LGKIKNKHPREKSRLKSVRTDIVAEVVGVPQQVGMATDRILKIF
jgi:hypothetical protein